MSAVRPWSIEDGEEAWERPVVRLSIHEPRRSAGVPSAAWQNLDGDLLSNMVEPVATSPRAFTPRTVQTLMTDKHLRDCGVRVHRHQERDWLVSVDADTLAGARPSDRWFAALTERIDELRALAAEEDEAFSEDSAREALAFARELNATQRPGAFLIGNGNIRLLWTEAEEQIGLQFRGDGSIQYVLFARRGNRMTTHMGDDEIGGTLQQITAARLRHLFRNP